jgi:hypothetical protein
VIFDALRRKSAKFPLSRQRLRLRRTSWRR